MRLLASGVDSTVIALWLGHESVATTQIYIHADLALKEQALARTAPLEATPAATSPPTPSWPSSTACDYADPAARDTVASSVSGQHLGITSASP
jgi:hypothetical protein